VIAGVFTYVGGFGCSPAAVYSLAPRINGTPTLKTLVISGNYDQTGIPLQYPFGMDVDRQANIIIADESSFYGCGSIFRYDPTKPVVTTKNGLWNFDLTPQGSNLNPYGLSPRLGIQCGTPGHSYLVNPADVAVVKVIVSANIPAQPPNVTINGAPSSSPEGTPITLTSTVS